MKKFFWLIATVLVVSGANRVEAQVVAGNDTLTGAGSPDGWTNILYINEDNPFDFGGGQGVLTYTNFWAAGQFGMVTPFVAEPQSDFPEFGDDFVIRAIGTTRQGGVDYTCAGEYQFPFHDTETFEVEDGWVVGFLTSDPAGESLDARSPIPFVGSVVEGWLTGSGAAGQGLPAIELNQTILEGASGTDVDAYGFREYEFNVSAVAGNTKPPLNAGGKIGDACPAPVEGSFGAPLPLTNGTPDGWSGVPVMYGNDLPAGETVDVVRYYAADDRAFDVESELYTVVPLIVRQEDGSVDGGEGFFSIFEVGPTHIPTEAGENIIEWGSSPIPDDGNLYHPAALQWFDGADDANGGVIAFGDGTGDGMHYFNVDTTTFIPDDDIGEIEPGFELSALDIHTSPAGGRAYQLNFQMSSGGGGEPGDFNGDGNLDAVDINDLAEQIRLGESAAKYDLNEDGNVNLDDHSQWVIGLKGTWYGDSNFDGEFNSSDFVQVFTSGLYETGQAANWETGDWDGDGKFDSSDFVVAFTDGGYELGPRGGVAAVPEPAGWFATLLGTVMMLAVARKHQFSCR